MPDPRTLGIAVKYQLDRISRGLIQLGGKYIAGQIKGKQLLNGVRNLAVKIENELERLELTELGGSIENLDLYRNDGRVVLGDHEEDMSNLRTRDPDDVDEDVNFG